VRSIDAASLGGSPGIDDVDANSILPTFADVAHDAVDHDRVDVCFWPWFRRRNPAAAFASFAIDGKEITHDDPTATKLQSF
jgi:hypothetical protein